MKKTLFVIISIAICLSGYAAGQSNPADEAYIKAMTEKDPAAQARLLKDFLAKFSGKGSQYENFANAHLCILNYPGKTEKEAIEYGEKALALGGLDDATRVQILLIASGLHIKSGQNLDRAKSQAQQVIDLGNANKAKTEEGSNSAQWAAIAGAGYYVLAQAQEKGNDDKAVDSYIAAYGILKKPEILASVKKMAKTMYDAKNFTGAEKAARAAYNVGKDSTTAVFLGQTLYKAGKTDEALAIFKEAYAQKKTGELAYNIALIIAQNAKGNPAANQQAIDALLEAAFTYPAKSQECLGMAQSLFFTSSSDAKINEVITKIQEKNKQIEALTKSFNTKFADKDEEDLTDAEKAEMNKILADIETVKKEIEKLQSSSAEMTAKWQKRMQDVRTKLGIK